MMNNKNNKNSGSSSKNVVTPRCAFCEGAGEKKIDHWQFSKPVDGVLVCPKLLAYKCKLCGCAGHVEKRCTKRNSKPAVTTKPINLFCRFCFNAQKDNYQSHNQFDANKFVQCPVLLEIVCKNCGKQGHTKKYCLETPSIKPIPITKKRLEILECIEEVIEQVIVPEQKYISPKNSWAGIAATAAPKPVPKPAPKPAPAVVQAPEVEQAPAVEQPSWEKKFALWSEYDD